ncbi:MAG TPA: aspartate kinase [Thermotogota bacterium]|nr:aspartate kinase [Thermotogota bacterium]HPJ87889.1 aspartate kinase [Thermotogota bacterium]HPR94982.1 aspartate kinase [Thermotogota bacterium]
MQVCVQKYGGSSLADTEKIDYVAKRILEKVKRGYKLTVVVSANGNTTNRLIEKAREINSNPGLRELDMLVSTGEQMSAALVTMSLQKLGASAISVNAFQIGIKTDSVFSSAKIMTINTNRINRLFTENDVIVVTGFQGITEENEITTLGRGGSDTSAVALAAVLNCDCEIFSDFDGIFSLDPRIRPDAKKLDIITYDEMLEMAKLGANVLHSRAVEIAKKFSVNLRCASTFNDKGGTIVTSDNIEAPVVTGLSIMKDQIQITLSNLPLDAMTNSEIFEVASKNHMNVDMISIIQISDHFDVSFTVIENKVKDVKMAYEEILEKYRGTEIKTNPGFIKISVVGLGMRTESGVASRFFKALSKKEITVRMVTTSEIKISALVGKEYLDDAVDCLTEEFSLCIE